MKYVDKNYVNPSKACAFTGHRLISLEDCEKCYSYITKIVKLSCDAGRHDTYIVGGAIGFDTVAATAVLDMRDKGYPVRLFVAVPCKDQDKKWSDEQKARYREILEQADGVIMISYEYTKTCMKERDYYMVDQSTRLVAYCDPSRRPGGTSLTVKYAKRLNRPVTNLFDLC